MFLANENFPKPSITLLREKGFHVVSIQEKSAGISDEAVLKEAIDQDLIILTFDRDYGELIFRYAQTNPPGVIYFRHKGSDPLFAGQLMIKLLEEKQLSFQKTFTVIEEKNIRQRFYYK
jgi:predicted nuclease of predicted toxin-antitoxin system